MPRSRYRDGRTVASDWQGVASACQNRQRSAEHGRVTEAWRHEVGVMGWSFLSIVRMALATALLAAVLGEAANAGETSSIVAVSDARFDGPESEQAREQDLQELQRALPEHQDSYELLWRAARAAWAIGDRLDDEKDSDRLKALGKQALEWAERAVAARPDGIEGRFYHGLAVSLYARGIGMFRSMLKGLGGEFESDMESVIKESPDWGCGAGYRALGRYFYQVPRPKRDLQRSEDLLRQSLRVSPNWLRTRLYLADTLAAEGREQEAGKEYRFVLEHDPDPAETNETQTLRAGAREGLAGLSQRAPLTAAPGGGNPGTASAAP